MNLTSNISQSHQSSIVKTTKCSFYILNDFVEDIKAFSTFSIVLCVIHSIIALTSIFTNGLVIAGIVRTPSLHTPSNVLLCCLAVTDFLAGAVTESMVVASHIAKTLKSYEVYCTVALTASTTAYSLSGVSYLTLTAVCLDRFLALELHLRYREIVTVPRILKLEAGIWFSVGIVMITPFLPHFKDFELIVGCVMVFGFLTNLLIYYKIFKIVRKHQSTVKAQSELSRRFHGHEDNEFRRIKRSSLTMAAVFVVFVLCYTPHMCASFAYYVSESTIMGKGIRIAYEISAVLVFLNSTLNPLLYCFRIKEIRLAVKGVLQKVAAAFAEIRRFLPQNDDFID